MKEEIQTQTPTPSELEILNVLWSRGPSTVREVNDVLRERRDTDYTTTLKFLQNMTEKGLVARDDSARAHQYRAVLDEEKERRRLVDDLMDRAFGGTAWPADFVDNLQSRQHCLAKNLRAVGGQTRGDRESARRQ